MPDDRREIPAAALHMRIGEMSLGDNGEGAKTAPFKMRARSGDALDHWFWGRIVHDFEGMTHNSRIPIDYCHDSSEVIGYGNKFDTASGSLEVEGALTPYKDSDRPSEIIAKSQMGVPYQASIFFDDASIQDIPAGVDTEVNGKKFSGPGVVVREWSLRGVAVCPYGYDSNTETRFSKSDVCSCKVLEMPETTTDQPVSEDKVSVDDTETVDDSVESDVDVEETTETSDVETQEEEETVQLSDGPRFLECFGDRGGVWFAEGKTFSEAQQLYVAELLEENKSLKQKLSASCVDGEETAVGFQSADDTKKKKTLQDVCYPKRKSK
jgi:hypothetical protein